MKTKFFFFLSTFFCLFSGNLLSLPPLAQPEEITINNRVLVNINNRPITVLDLQKQLDLIYIKQFPDFKGSVQVKLQFYQTYWKQALIEYINKELILADAETIELKIPSSEVKQEMERVFGDQIIEKLHQANLSYDDAYKMIEEDLKIQRMQMLRIRAKALRKISPQKVLEAYEKHQDELKQPETFTYYVIHVRDFDNEEALNEAQRLYQFLSKNKDQFDKLPELVNQYTTQSKTALIKITEKFTHPSSQVSKSYKEALSLLESGKLSSPIKQKSKNGAIVYRLFYLENYTPETIPPLSQVEKQLTDFLTQQAINEEMEKYISSLREQYHLTDEDLKTIIPQDFVPFSSR